MEHSKDLRRLYRQTPTAGLDDLTPRLKVVTWPWVNSRGNVATDSAGRPYVALVWHIEKPGEVINNNVYFLVPQ